jgi:hypothetical protein
VRTSQQPGQAQEIGVSTQGERHGAIKIAAEL